MSTFRLERDLQTLVRANLPQLKRGLKTHDGNRERVLKDGRRIDIETIGAKGSVVIELKAGQAGLTALKQIRDYMKTVEQEDGRGPVQGILVAKSFAPQAIIEAKKVPKIELRQYTFTFAFDRPEQA
jgi:RecB family endonuclease NucS